MNTISKWTMALTLVSGAVYATQPPDVVVSDANGNTAMATGALYDLTTGESNTAAGYLALNDNTTGGYNTATGYEALQYNTTGSYNTANGYQALYGVGSGNWNTAVGMAALASVQTGSYNTATGAAALVDNNGSNNTAMGFQALRYNYNGSDNTASGHNALENNNASDNVAMGSFALSSSTSGTNNIGLGFKAGWNLTTGSNNVEISNQGASGDNNTIKIGSEGTQTSTYIAGIYGNNGGTYPVYIDSAGRLWTQSSSERFKTGIEPMGSNTEKLQQLRPVMFHYKTDPKGVVRYGLIAEEVAKVYPNLVVRDDKGQIDGVRYEALAPMLLNEMQKEHSTVATLVVLRDSDAMIREAQAAAIRDLKQQVAELNNLKEEMRAALLKLQSKDKLVAQR